jgi:hypothetical protein
MSLVLGKNSSHWLANHSLAEYPKDWGLERTEGRGCRVNIRSGETIPKEQA